MPALQPALTQQDCQKGRHALQTLAACIKGCERHRRWDKFLDKFGHPRAHLGRVALLIAAIHVTGQAGPGSAMIHI